MQRRLLSGTYDCSIDNRFRLAIPARLREPFAEGVTIAQWLDEGSLVLVPRLEWSDLVEETFGPMRPLIDDQRDLRRYVLGGTYEQDALDRQGRVLIPAHLRAHAGLETQATVVGVGEYLEVWEPARLAAKIDDLRREGVSARARRLADRTA